MAVVKSKRSEGKLTVLTKTSELMEYTIRITGNEKSFPKRYRWSVTQSIVREAVAINAYAHQANGIFVKTNAEYELRRELQTRALAMTYSLLSEIDIAFRVFGIESDRVKFWTGLICDVQRLIRNWQRAEEARHAEQGEPEAQEAQEAKTDMG